MNVVSLNASIDKSYQRMIAAQAELELVDSFTAKRPSVAERLAAGKALRGSVPRAAHGKYSPASDRPDPVEILEQQNAVRIQKLVPVRYARMLGSPFAFLRGSAAVMAADLSATPVTGIGVAACGDMHVANFGAFGSAERNLVFAINDFDETFPGPWEWDLKRLAASAVVAVRFMGGDKAGASEAARGIVRSYRERMRSFAEMSYLGVWYSRIDEQAILDGLAPKQLRRAERFLSRARDKGHVQALEKMTERVDGEHRIVEEVPLIVRETHTDAGTPSNVALDRMLQSYINSKSDDRRRLLARYRIVDSARKVVGVGSVGTGCWVVLLQGVDEDDPLFLQVKEAQASVLAPYVDYKMPFTNNGQRVVVGQRLIQGSPDIFLGWGEADGRHFYVRQLADMKGGIKLDENDAVALGAFNHYCMLCGWALALAHAKSGDPAMIAGYCGNSDALDDAIAKFGAAYAKQTERDHATLEKARRSGRIRVAAEALIK